MGHQPREAAAPEPPPGKGSRPFRSWDHLLYGLAWTGFVAVLILAALLHPDASGLGTHTGLGLPPCGFRQMTGKPCPSCGMTTCFAWLVRGRPVEAWQAQPAGVAVFLSAAALWLYLPFAWFRRRPIDHVFDLKAFVPVVLSLIVLILAVWVRRLLL